MMRTELGFWSVLVGTVGVTGIAKVKALQSAREYALACTVAAGLVSFGTHSAQRARRRLQTYALRACIGALLADSSPALASRS